MLPISSRIFYHSIPVYIPRATNPLSDFSRQIFHSSSETGSSKRNFKAIPLTNPTFRFNSSLRSYTFHHHQENGYSNWNQKNSNFTLLTFLAFFPWITKKKAIESANIEEENIDPRIKTILGKEEEERSVEESIELFDYLIKNGEKEVAKAKGKDIVVFLGNTDAGKSTLINYLSGCTIIDSDKGYIVDPNSEIKQVTKIGTQASHSQTLFPRQVPNTPLNSLLTFFDMPGFEDTRGIEVGLAHTILLKKLVENAKSVRIVLAFEDSLINATRGKAWKETVNLFHDRFQGLIGTGNNDLSLFITKTNRDIPSIVKDIKKFKNDTLLDLSDYVVTYQPLNKENRENKLNQIFKSKKFDPTLPVKVALSATEMFKVTELGEKIEASIWGDLGETNKIDVAVKKVIFTHQLLQFENLKKKMYDRAIGSVNSYAQSTSERIEPRNEPDLNNRIKAYKDYLFHEQHFKKFPGVNFNQLNTKIAHMRKESKKSDRRWIVWDNPTATLVGASLTASLVGLSILYPPTVVTAILGSTKLTALAAGFFPGLFTSYSSLRYVWPTEKDKDYRTFYDGV